MDNFEVNVISEGRRNFNLAFEIGFGKHESLGSFAIATHYVKDPEFGFVLLWEKEGMSEKLPIAMHDVLASELVWNWLQREADYGKKPDHDGDNGKGWRVYARTWGHIGPYKRAILAVQPIWAMYGK